MTYEEARELVWRGFTKFAIDPGPEEDAEIICVALDRPAETRLALPFDMLKLVDMLKMTR